LRTTQRRIVVGGSTGPVGPPPPEFETVTARTCKEVRRLLWGLSRVELVIADLNLPDGNWHDVVRSVARERIPGHLYVLSSDGEPLLSCAIGPDARGASEQLDAAGPGGSPSLVARAVAVGG
jgi:hypothetical protein